MSYGSKIVRLGWLCVVLMISAFIVWIMSESRESSERGAIYKITSEWGKEVTMRGPAFNNPDKYTDVLPLDFKCVADLRTQTLHRNIYQAEVYTADIKISGNFSREQVAAEGDTLRFHIDIPTTQLTDLGQLTIGGKPYEWEVKRDKLTTYVDIAEMPEIIEFSADLSIRGSKELKIEEIGKNTEISMHGNARNPSFCDILPMSRTVKDNNFSAEWKYKNLEQKSKLYGNPVYAGVEFLSGVDIYQKVSRSMKYAFIIIVLTFICVLFAEITMRHEIPLLNYFLIGAALVLFYSLLLSFAEFLSFGYAYLISVTMTVLLITGYMWLMLRSHKGALTIGTLITAMYGGCYIMLSLNTYALLMGSMLLFIALAAMMYGSLKLKDRYTD